MSNLAQSCSFDHAPSELSLEERAAVEAIVARGGPLLSPFAADQISAHGSTPAIDNIEWPYVVPLSNEEQHRLREALEDPSAVAMALASLAKVEARELAAFFKAASRQNRATRTRATQRGPRSHARPRAPKPRHVSSQASTRAGPSDDGDPDPEPSSRERRRASDQLAGSALLDRTAHWRARAELRLVGGSRGGR